MNEPPIIAILARTAAWICIAVIYCLSAFCIAEIVSWTRKSLAVARMLAGESPLGVIDSPSETLAIPIPPARSGAKNPGKVQTEE